MVESFLNDIKQLYENDRYNVDRWLSLLDQARHRFHPQHEVMSEIAKWVVPIMARGHGMSISNFPVALVKTKVELAMNYLAVLDIVERGISKFRAKTMYEMVDNQLYLLSLDFREGRCDRSTVKVITEDFVKKLEEVMNIMDVLGVNSGYEEMVVRGTATLRLMCQKLLGVPNKFGSTKNES